MIKHAVFGMLSTSGSHRTVVCLFLHYTFIATRGFEGSVKGQIWGLKRKRFIAYSILLCVVQLSLCLLLTARLFISKYMIMTITVCGHGILIALARSALEVSGNLSKI